MRHTDRGSRLRVSRFFGGPLIGALALAVSAGCGGEVGASFVPNESVEPTGSSWSNLQRQLQSIKGGRYEAVLVKQRCSTASVSECRLTSQTIRSNGTFGLDPDMVKSELHFERPVGESSGEHTVEMRGLPNGALYSIDPTATGPCWLTLDRSYAPTFKAGYQYGLDVLASISVPYDLPASGRAVETPGQADALAVIRTLGIHESLDPTYGINAAVRKTLTATPVSVSLTIGPRNEYVAFEVDGRQVASEIGSATGTTQSAILSTIQAARSTYRLSDLDVLVAVTAPSADLRVPRGAPAGTTCAADR